jgi:hypothetical protein
MPQLNGCDTERQAAVRESLPTAESQHRPQLFLLFRAGNIDPAGIANFAAV